MAVPMPGLSEKRIWPHATAHTWLGLGMGLGLEVGIWPHAITSLTRHRPHLALGEPRPVKLADVVGDAVSRAVERECLHEQHTEQQHGPHLQA